MTKEEELIKYLKEFVNNELNEKDYEIHISTNPIIEDNYHYNNENEQIECKKRVRYERIIIITDKQGYYLEKVEDNKEE